MMEDPSIVTDSFASKSDHLIAVTDIEQMPVRVKRKNLKRDKTVLEAGRELEMGYDRGSNIQFREPTLQDSVELLDDEFLSKHHIEDEIRILPNIYEDDTSALPQKSYNTTKNEKFVGIQVLPSDKEKNPPYLVKGKAITTDRLTPVKFIISGVKAMQKICISMRYTDELHKNTAVKPCKLHQDWKQRSETLPADFNFYLTTECVTYETTESSHPTAVIYIQEGFIDDDEDFTLSVVFVCLNSCHRLHGKKMELGIAVYDHTGTSLVEEERFTIRACKNVKRDHVVKSRYALKRRYEMEKDWEENPLKIEKIDGENFSVSSFFNDTSTGRDEDKPRKITFQMKSKEDQDIIRTMIDRLQGVRWYP